MRRIILRDAIVIRASDPGARGFHAKNPFVDQLRIIGPGAKTILDVGAHTGETTQRYFELFPEAVIHCFEPFPGSYAQLAERFTGVPRVVTHPLAVTDAVGPRKLHSFTHSVTNSVLAKAPGAEHYEDHGQMEEHGIVDVMSTSLDRFCEERAISRIDILKLDIQGAELLALRGATRALTSHAFGLIYTEVNFVPSYEDQAWFDDIATYLRGYHYGIFDFYNFAYTAQGQLKWGDAIFLPTEYQEDGPWVASSERGQR